MAGHSKWANIKHRKQAADLKKASVYAQLSKEISVAAKLGGKDPNFNFRLRNAIERAKIAGMPNDNIQRAIDKLQNKSQIEEIVYEGYGGSGIALLILAATDNRNRTASELRLILSRHGGNLGETGCVGWNFKHVGLIQLKNEQKLTENQLLEILSELEIDDYEFLSDREINLICATENFERNLSDLKKRFEAVGQIIYLPQNQIKVPEENVDEFEKLITKLEENEDIQEIYHNAEYTLGTAIAQV